jgi:hypothetical protein
MREVGEERHRRVPALGLEGLIGAVERKPPCRFSRLEALRRRAE